MATAEPGLLTIVPPIAAIVVAVWRKNALMALAFGLWLTYFLSSHYQPLQSVVLTAQGLWQTLANTGNLRIVVYSLLIGGMLEVMQQSGGLTAFVNHITGRSNWINSPQRAALVPASIGTLIFTDTNLSLFTAGMASRRLFARFSLSRARLAYLIDSTCAPVSVLILINGWGAYILGLIERQGIDNGVSILIDTIGYNFYALIAVTLAYYTAASGKVFGPMKAADRVAQHPGEAEQQAHQAGEGDEKAGKLRYFLLPLILMIGGTLGLLWWTGDGDIRQGSGSFSVLWAVVAAMLVLALMVLADRVMSVEQVLLATLRGIKKMGVVVAILVLSFAFGDAVKTFGTGVYVSGLLSTDLPLLLIAPVIFLTAAVMAFATGSSWSTFAILIPIAIPTAQVTGLPLAFLVAAVLGGGIFGDHASPISDTTVVASLASGCDHIEHVKTQLPYALFGGGATMILYLLVGLTLH